ncbi:hypothetical protein ACFE04_021286 [Oxalis oulophora]
METACNDLSINEDEEEEDDLPLQWSLALRADRRRLGQEPSKWLRGADGMAVLHGSTTGGGEATYNTGELSPRVSFQNPIDHDRCIRARNNVVVDAAMDNITGEERPFLVQEGNKRQRARSIPSSSVSDHIDSLIDWMIIDVP